MADSILFPEETLSGLIAAALSFRFSNLSLSSDNLCKPNPTKLFYKTAFLDKNNIEMNV